MDSLNVSVLASLPPVDESGVDALLAAEIARDPHKLLALESDTKETTLCESVELLTGKA